MGDDAHRWLLTDASTPLTEAEPNRRPGADELVVAVDACSLWRRNVGFAFGTSHADAGAPDLTRRIDGHVVEAGEDALYWVDRPVALTGAVPCGHHEDCWTGKVAVCPHRQAAGAEGEPPGETVVTPAREARDASKHQPAPRAVGLDPFKGGA